MRSKSAIPGCILILIAAVLHSEQIDSAAILFLSTNPIHADVLLDGQPVAEQTPLLLREVVAGSHELEIRKQGFVSEHRVIELAAGEITAIEIELSSLYFSSLLPEEGRVIIRGTEEQGGDTLYRLPEGSYSFRRGEGALRIDPVLPQDGWIRGLNLAIPLSLAFTTVLTLHDIYYPKRAALKFSDDFSLSPATLSAFGLSLTLISFDIALWAKRKKARQAFSYDTLPRDQALYSAEAFYERAENLLALGQLDEALRFYARVLETYKDSPLYPYALFKTARIHFLTGEDSPATIEFNLIADHYPLPDLYDKAQRGLADILLRQKAYRESIGQLSRMIFADPLYTEEEIELLKAEVLEGWFADDPVVLPELIDSYVALVKRYSNSESLDLYSYKAAYYLHFGNRDAEAVEYLKQIDAARSDEDLTRKVQDLRRSIGEAE